MTCIRRVTADDWSEWRRLRREALRESPDAFDSSLADWTGAGDTEQRWRDRLDAVPINLVAESDGVGVGLVSLTRILNHEAELISLWVAPPARGRGVGEALVRALVDRARESGALRVVLEVERENEPAMSLYARCGFAETRLGPVPRTSRRRMSLEV